MIKKRPIISIVVPVYNVEKYLKRCIDSILNQTLKDFELILVDDGSTDLSGYICDEFLEKDSRIKVIHKKNGGLSSARNSGIDISRGKYIGFIDSDDYITKDMYEFLYNLCEQNEADIGVCNSYRIIDNEKTYKFEKRPFKIMNTEEALSELIDCKIYGVSSCDKLFKLELFKDVRFPVGKIYEDSFTIYKLINKANLVAYNGEPKYYHVFREGSITNSKIRKECIHYLESKREIYNELSVLYPKLENKLFSQYYWSMWEFIADILREKKSSELQEEMDKVLKEIKGIHLKNKNLNTYQKIRLFLFKFNSELYVNRMERRLLGDKNEDK